MRNSRPLSAPPAFFRTDAKRCRICLILNDVKEMANMELDPLFMKALALLRSKSKDSTDLLKQMLDDVLGKTTGKLSSKPASPSPSVSRIDVSAKKTTVKRPADKSSFGAALSSADTGIVSKKPKIETEVRQSRIQPRKPVIDDDDDDDDDHGDEDDDDDDTEEEQTEEKEEKTRQSSGEEDNEAEFGKEEEKLGASGDDDEIWLGLACVVCKNLDISAGNTLIECQECHNLYHQKCHTPPVTDTDPNDPRLVWYCAKCKRNMKKMAAKKPANLPEAVITTGSSSSSSSSSPSSSSSSSGKDQDKNQDQTSPMNLFRRADPKPSPTSTTSAQQPFGGLASYAANLTSHKHSSSSKSASSGSSRIITSTGAKIAPSSITSRSSSTSGTATTMGGKSAKPQGVQRSTSVSQSSKWQGAPSSSSTTAKTMSSSAQSGKALPQTSTASAMKRLHMMKKKASKR